MPNELQRALRGDSSTRRRPPTDYTQRSVRLRLFGLIAALMVVLALAERAGNPKTWNWLWELDRGAGGQAAAHDPRVEPQPLRTEGDPAGTFVSEIDADQPETQAKQDLTIDPVQRAWGQGWKDVFDRLDADQRTLLFQMLYSGISHATLDPEKQTDAANLLHAVGKLWEDYQVVAFQSVAELKGDDQALWVDVLRQVNARFNNDLRPALQGVIDGRTPTEADERALIAARQTLLSLTRSRIEDDTVFRPAEREIWFYELARVRDTPAGELSAKSVGNVAYLQLFHQPDDYRGQVVSIAGTVRLAYRVQAPPNFLGIKQYYVYWIHPRGGPTSPIVVYALDAPAGFPAIKDKDVDEGTTELREEVEVTGVFFKRWAYLAKGGDATYTAPLLVASVPQWTPAPPLLNTADRMPLSVEGVLLTIAGTLVAALVFGLLLYWLMNRKKPAETSAEPADMAALANLPLGPSTHESLRELERQAKSGMLGKRE